MISLSAEINPSSFSNGNITQKFNIQIPSSNNKADLIQIFSNETRLND
jgi:hypothetical protein